jgi:hypothetical protein
MKKHSSVLGPFKSYYGSIMLVLLYTKQERAQYAILTQYRLARDKHSSILSPYLSFEKNKAFRIVLAVFYIVLV